MTRLQASASSPLPHPLAASGSSDHPSEDGTAPRAGKKPRAGVKGVLTRVLHSRCVDSALPEFMQKKARRAARLSSAGSGDNGVGPTIAPFGGGIRERAVDVPESSEYVVEFEDTASEQSAVVTDEPKKGKLRQAGERVLGERVSVWLADTRRRRSGKHAGPVEEIAPPAVEVDGKAAERTRKKAVEEAVKLWAVLSKAYCQSATPEKELDRGSLFKRSAQQSMRRAKKTRRDVMDTLGLSGPTAMESLVQHMHAFPKASMNAVGPGADTIRMDALKDGLDGSTPYEIGLMCRRLKNEAFRREIKIAFSAGGNADCTDSGNHLAREAEGWLASLDQAVTYRMQTRFQQAPLRALIDAGLLVDIRRENYETQAPAIADAVINLCHGYWHHLCRPGESMDAYLLRLVQQEVQPAWRIPIKVALAVDAPSGDLLRNDLTSTICRSTTSREIATCYLAVLQKLWRALEDKQPSPPLEIAWGALAATLGADDGDMQGQDLMAEIVDVVEEARRLASSMRSGNAPIPDPADAGHSRVRRFLDEWDARMSAARGTAVAGNEAGQGLAAIAMDAANPDHGLQGDDGPLACLVQTGALCSSETGRALRSYRRDTAASGAVAAATEGADDSEALMRMLASSFPKLKRGAQAADSLLIHDRGGSIRRFGTAVWQALKSQFASGRARQKARKRRRQRRMERAVAGAVHYLFKPGSSARHAGKLDAGIRRLVKAMKALEDDLGEERARSLLEQTLDMALATGDQNQVICAWERLLPPADGSRPTLVIPPAKGRVRRMLRHLVSRWSSTVPEDEITARAERIREAAAASLKKIAVHIPVRDILERIIKHRKEAAHAGVEAEFRALMEAYAASCKDDDVAGWLAPAVKLVANRQDVRWLEGKMARHSMLNGGAMSQFFKPGQASVTIDKGDYVAYDYFAEALYAACRKSMADDPAPGAGDSDAYGHRTDGTSDSERSGSLGSPVWSTSASGSASTSRSSSPGRAASDGMPAPLPRAETVYKAAQAIVSRV